MKFSSGSLHEASAYTERENIEDVNWIYRERTESMTGDALSARRNLLPKKGSVASGKIFLPIIMNENRKFTYTHTEERLCMKMKNNLKWAKCSWRKKKKLEFKIYNNVNWGIMMR